MNTPLQLSGYCIDRLKVEANPTFDGRQERNVAITVGPRAARHATDPSKHQIELSVTFGRVKGDPKGAPYVGAIGARAFFTLDASDLTESEQARLVLLNGSAILLGLLRAQVAQVTALSSYGVFLLPPVNLVEAFRAQVEAAEADIALSEGTAPPKKARSVKRVR